MQPTADTKFDLLPVSETEFIRTDGNIRYLFVRNAGGDVSGITLRFNEGSSEAPRISKETLIPYELLQAARADEAVAA